MTSLQLASCSMFVQRRQGTLGRQQWTVVLPEHPVLKSRMTAIQPPKWSDNEMFKKLTALHSIHSCSLEQPSSVLCRI